MTRYNKILITGGRGFIGTHFVEFLLKKGNYDIKIYDNLSVGRKEYIESILKTTEPKNPSIELIEGDVRDKKSVEKAVREVKAVVHLAAHTNVVGSLKNPEEDFQINAIGTFNILEACRTNGVERFIYASSNAVVGEKEPPINEEKIPAPISPYGASKLFGEALCSAYHQSFGIKAVSLRFANAYGPYSDHKTSVIATFIKRAKESKPLIIHGDGNQTRDFIHANDVCQAIYLALNYDPVHSRSQEHSMSLVFQIATGIETKIKDLAKIISKLAVLSNLPKPEIQYSSARKGEIRRNFSDISKAKSLLTYNPRVNLHIGIKETWNSFERN